MTIRVMTMRMIHGVKDEDEIMRGDIQGEVIR